MSTKNNWFQDRRHSRLLQSSWNRTGNCRCVVFSQTRPVQKSHWVKTSCPVFISRVGELNFSRRDQEKIKHITFKSQLQLHGSWNNSSSIFSLPCSSLSHRDWTFKHPPRYGQLKCKIQLQLQSLPLVLWSLRTSCLLFPQSGPLCLITQCSKVCQAAQA